MTHSGVEGDGCDEVDVLEAAETLSPGDVPQSDRFIHGRREQEEVLRETKKDGIEAGQRRGQTGEQTAARLTLDQDRSSRSAVCPLYLQKGTWRKGAFLSSVSGSSGTQLA